MKLPVIVCAGDIDHLAETKSVLEEAFEVRYVPAMHRMLAEQIPDADACLASLQVRMTDELMQMAPNLKVIATPSTGVDHIDLEAAKNRGIAVLCLKDDTELLDKITTTAELAWALMLACVRRIPEAVTASSSGMWACDLLCGHQIAFKTLGILGCGRLGTMVANYGKAFRMKVLGCDIRDVKLPDVEMVSFYRLLQESDVLMIHIHITDENRGLIGRDEFAMMKDGAVLINTSRGAIVDEAAMLDALLSGKLSAAGLDVIEGQWRDDLVNHPLIAHERTHDNLIITPHLGDMTLESQEMAYAATARKLAEFMHELM